MIVYYLQGGDPLEGGIIFCSSGNLSGRSDAPAVGIDPYAQEDLGVICRAARVTLDGGDFLVVGGEIKAPDEIPYRPCLMPFGDEPLHIDRHDPHLLPVDGNEPGLYLSAGRDFICLLPLHAPETGEVTP
jgi:hypothetical protein